VIGIRAASHGSDGYDRITFDLNGPIPSYEVGYVDKLVAAGSGAPVTIPGQRFLRITFRPAQAHDTVGASTVGPRSQTLNLPTLAAYAVTDDAEGVFSVGLGLNREVGFRVGELPGSPGRVYVDVAS
jgi:hypothetical protein